MYNCMFNYIPENNTTSLARTEIIYAALNYSTQAFKKLANNWKTHTKCLCHTTTTSMQTVTFYATLLLTEVLVQLLKQVSQQVHC